MGFKGWMILIAVIVSSLLYVLLGSESLSNYIEQYSVEKLKEPELEKVAFFNILYMDFTTKYDRLLDLAEKFEMRYEKSDRIPDVMMMVARTYEATMKISMARDTLKKLVEEYPDAKNVEEAKRKLMELKTYL